MKVIHHNDLDGRAAAHVVAQAENLENPDDFIEVDYPDKAYSNFSLDKIDFDELVYIVDFHLKIDDMRALMTKTRNVIWIDHHISTIKEYENFEFKVDGIRKVGISGCVLTYQYLHPYREVPKYLRYICDRDVWAFIYGDTTKNFFSGSNLYDTNPLSIDWILFEKHPEDIIRSGEIVEQYKFMHNKEYIEKYGYYTRFEDHEAIVVNQGLCGSEVFDSLDSLPTLQILYAFNGEEYSVSLRSEEVNVSKIAQKYGGGGHEGASGFQCEELPWRI